MRYYGNWKEPKTKLGKFFWYILFPSFIFSLILSALIELGIKLFGGKAELTQIWLMVFIIVFLILVLLNIKSVGLFIFGNFFLFFFIAAVVFSFLNLNSNKLNFICGIIVAAVVCFFLAKVKDKKVGL